MLQKIAKDLSVSQSLGFFEGLHTMACQLITTQVFMKPAFGGPVPRNPALYAGLRMANQDYATGFDRAVVCRCLSWQEAAVVIQRAFRRRRVRLRNKQQNLDEQGKAAARPEVIDSLRSGTGGTSQKNPVSTMPGKCTSP